MPETEIECGICGLLLDMDGFCPQCENDSHINNVTIDVDTITRAIPNEQRMALFRKFEAFERKFNRMDSHQANIESELRTLRTDIKFMRAKMKKIKTALLIANDLIEMVPISKLAQLGHTPEVQHLIETVKTIKSDKRSKRHIVDLSKEVI